MKKVLVTGANGQLGKCLRDACAGLKQLDVFFESKEDLNIADEGAVASIFDQEEFDFCINTAAYTQVDKAEKERDKAFSLNADAVKNLAIQCARKEVVLIHISTDYVFDGTKNSPYSEEDPTNPINVYGSSKLKGEEYIQHYCEKYFIIRTSWLYSQYGNNFMNYILKAAEENKQMTITTEQIGTPTNANDLAKVILKIVDSESKDYGIYHYSNQGETTWYGFAKDILMASNQFDDAKLVKTDHYRTFAMRPTYSVLDSSKIEMLTTVPTKNWKISLKNIINDN